MTHAKSILLPTADLKEGGMVSRSLEDREVVICRTNDGIYALDNICTHAYARLSEGRLRGNRLICPLHGASFDVRDGKVLGPPAIRPVSTHSVAVIDAEIIVSLKL